MIRKTNIVLMFQDSEVHRKDKERSLHPGVELWVLKIEKWKLGGGWNSARR